MTTTPVPCNENQSAWAQINHNVCDTYDRFSDKYFGSINNGTRKHFPPRQPIYYFPVQRKVSDSDEDIQCKHIQGKHIQGKDNQDKDNQGKNKQGKYNQGKYNQGKYNQGNNSNFIDNENEYKSIKEKI